jgi:peptidoglycan/xylan/chitin deacetylase (PgdA/CDA1 family)
MLHRVSKKNSTRISHNENMKVSPEYLEQFIIDAKSRGYSFISLLDLKIAVDKGETPKNSIIITLDDGYKDNLINGYPIFKKHQIPFMIYLSTYFIENNATPWWYILEELLLHSDSIIYRGKEQLLDSLTLKENMFLEIRENVLDGNTDVNSVMLYDLCRENEFDINGIEKEVLFLNWSDIEFLSADTGVEIGNHGHNHVNLSKCNKNTIKNEFTYADKLIYEHIGKRTMHYSYPYGLFDESTLDVLKFCGANTAVTTKPGVFAYKMSLLEIPRFMLHENMSVDELQVETSFRLLREML